MIGQIELKNKIMSQISNNTFPRFSILVGQSGSGKKMMCKFISTHLNAYTYYCETGVDAIRKMITESYKVSSKILYIIADADKMSLAAKNALLKVTEDPPQNAYFVITITDTNNILSTIKSRGTTFYMNTYTVDELVEYGKTVTNYTLSDEDIYILKNICETPGEVNKLFSTSDTMLAQNFYNYVEKVVDNIALVSGANSFKIGDRIAFKDTDTDKFDLQLFWKAFMTVCIDRLTTDPFKYSLGIKTTSKYLQELRVVGINKQATFDMWILDIRQEWMK